jgi:hypothetical protein
MAGLLGSTGFFRVGWFSPRPSLYDFANPRLSERTGLLKRPGFFRINWFSPRPSLLH